MMIIIYHAANSLDGNMIKSLLEQHDIHAYVLGEHLQGGVGDLPASDLVKVAVDDEHQASARSIIEEWDAGSIVEEESSTNLVDDGLSATS
ncbi:MAG: DUF2007 domain-containing protein [Methylophilaceae bacterium]